VGLSKVSARNPVFLGCSERDMYIPSRSDAVVCTGPPAAGGTVIVWLYHTWSHTMNDDELEVVRAMMSHSAC
jgi:hypothetical protein